MKSENNALKLESQICFPLYASSKEVIKKYKPYLDKLDLTYTQYLVMLVMWEKKKLNVKELGNCLYLDSGTLTSVLKKLEEKKYIDRNRCKEDERNVYISLTEIGEDLKEEASEIPFKMAQKFKLTEDEAKTLYQLLYKILN